MPNHIHILLKEGDLSLSEIMKKIEDRYVYLYNVKYDRCGHLFQDRYKSEPVDDDAYFKQLLRYIHRNPVKGMICEHPEDYLYSSWKEFLNNGSDAIIKICDTESVFARMPQDDLIEWVNLNVDDNCMDMDKERFVLTDKHAWGILSDISQCDNVEEFKQLAPDFQMQCIKEAICKGITIRQASRLSILSYSKIQKELSRAQRKDRDESMRNCNRGVRPRLSS